MDDPITEQYYDFEVKGRTASERAAFRGGLRSGIRLYAWWKDGVQQVGTCGRTLAQAMAWVDACAESDLNLTQDKYESIKDEHAEREAGE